jgi:peptidoglycan/LPS O-acetylase OafA/YrhL
VQRQLIHGKEQFPALTGIRAIGAACVFFVHLPFSFGYTIVIDVMAFFFVLSGFLIFYLYYENKNVRAGRLRQYFINRFARIYPVYFLLVTVAIFLHHDFRAIYLFKNYTLTHALFYNRADRAIEQSWSITTEECFYLLAPIFMFLVRKYNFVSALLSAISLLLVALLISTFPLSFLHTGHFVFTVTFFGHFFEFFCGIFLALIILKRKETNSVFNKGRRFTIYGEAGILLSIGILIFSGNMNDPERQTQFIVINNFVLPVAIALFYFGLITEKSMASRLLSSRVLYYPGRSSYSFYLVHMLVIEAIAIPLIEPHFIMHRNIYVLLVFIVTQLIAFLIFALYEEPVNLYIRKLFAGNKSKYVVKAPEHSLSVEGR